MGECTTADSSVAPECGDAGVNQSFDRVLGESEPQLFYESLRERLVMMARHVSRRRSVESPEDLASNIVTRILKHNREEAIAVPTYSDAYLRTCIRHELYSAARRSRRTIRIVSLEEVEAVEHHGAESAEMAEAEARDELERVKALVATLGEQKRLLVECLSANLDYMQISLRMRSELNRDVKPSALRVEVLRLRRDLKLRLGLGAGLEERTARRAARGR